LAYIVSHVFHGTKALRKQKFIDFCHSFGFNPGHFLLQDVLGVQIVEMYTDLAARPL
jgi:hypothetical protein